jgi:hypothetical protein
MSAVTDVPADVIAEAQRFIEQARWQFAWSMRYLPHEYTLRQWHREAGTEPDFLAMVRAIREHGYREHFGRKRVLVYLPVSGWRYWVMSRPERSLDETLDVTTLINRAEVDADGRPLKGPKWLREGVDLAGQIRLEVER